MKRSLLIPFLLSATLLPVDTPRKVPPLMEPYRDAAARILDTALADRTAWERLGYLCDHYPRRLSGSTELEGAVAWARNQMEADGLERVRTEPVMVPHWLRGRESAEILAPATYPLVMLGIGGSVGTPPDGLTADVVVVSSFEELDRLGAKVQGKIVLFNAPYTTYGQTVIYRIHAASRAARHGAVAALVRSVGPTSLRTPHTGNITYAETIRRIPAAAVTIEDAELMRRMQARGETIRVRLRMEAQMLADAPSANVLGELRGREKPQEIVLVGAHLDSWDVGQGANDDGGGCIAAWEAVRLLHRLELRPRRTIRVVLFTNEENGLRGATGYRDAHLAELKQHVLAIEADNGIARPLGFGVTASEKGLATAREIATLLDGIQAGQITEGGGGADVGPLGAEGVPTMGLSADMSRYFDVHHTPADTVDKIDPAELSRCVATLAVMAYVVADLPDRFGK